MIDPKRFLIYSLFGSVLLGIMHLFFKKMEFAGGKLFHMGRDFNIPDFYSASLFLLIGILCWRIYKEEKILNKFDDSKPFKYDFLWYFPIVLSGLLSLEEMLGFHENFFVVEGIKVLYELDRGFVYVQAWILLLSPLIFLAIGFLWLFFKSRLPVNTFGKSFLWYGVMSWLSALLLDHLNQFFTGMGPYHGEFALVLEETLEMMGSIFLITGLLYYLNAVTKGQTQAGKSGYHVLKQLQAELTKVGVAKVFLLAIVGVVFLFIGSFVIGKSLEHKDAKLPLSTQWIVDDIKKDQHRNIYVLPR